MSDVRHVPTLWIFFFFVVNARWELDTQIFFSISMVRFVKKAVCVSCLSVLRGVQSYPPRACFMFTCQ